jgi:hypothetical protein
MRFIVPTLSALALTLVAIVTMVRGPDEHAHDTVEIPAGARTAR